VATAGVDDRIAAVRRFNRFYTRRIGVLAHGHLGSAFSLTETRVLWELAHRDAPTASALARDLGLDAGYLSRVLARFARQRLLRRAASPTDARQTHLALTTRGRKVFASLDDRARSEIDGMLRGLAPADQARLVAALTAVESVLAPPTPGATPYVLRPPRVGDMGWIVHRHGVLYRQEYGYDERFEALVAKIIAQYVEEFDPRRDRCWIAERHGQPVGSVFAVKKSRTVAKLRLLLVEPEARGLGIGKRLVDECVAFAKEAGYRTLTLWTQRNLYAARRLYKQAGFRLTGRQRHTSFGPPSVAEVWDLDLRRAKTEELLSQR
jgi:DNA-binding MarR family transcriptional regulator/GNAT superfamily N-acetyltransferase